MTIDYTQSEAQGKENKIVNLGLTKVPFPAITGLTLAADIHLKHPDFSEELTFNTVDADDIVWVITDIANWWGMPEAEVPDIPRGLDDGSYDVRGRWRARNLTLSGSILVPDASKAPAARQKLMEYCNLVYKGGWLIVDETPYRKAAFVRLVGQPTFENINPRGRINFTIPLKSGDPLKYSWDVNASYGYSYANSITSARTVPNNGNYQVAGVFDLSGPITAPATIKSKDLTTNTTQTLTITTSLRATNFSSDITYAELSSGVATITVSPQANTASHGFLVGDVISVSNTATSYQTGGAVVTAVTTTTVSYSKFISASISKISLSSNVATVTTASNHGIVANNVVYITGNNNPIYDGVYTVLSAPTLTTFTFAKTASDQSESNGGSIAMQLAQSEQPAGSKIRLAKVDTMKIDTYNNTVTYRDLPDESRSTLAVNVDWIKLKPGDNEITFTTSKSADTGTCSLKYRSGWIG